MLVSTAGMLSRVVLPPFLVCALNIAWVELESLAMFSALRSSVEIHNARVAEKTQFATTAFRQAPTVQLVLTFNKLSAIDPTGVS